MRRWRFATLCLLLAAGFTALGVWQVERRAWKLDLIARVDARVHAPPQPLPSRIASPMAVEYRRVRVTGSLLHDRETLVQAVTERGPGWWVMTPMATDRGVVLVNRGFVPPERRDPATRAAGQVPGKVTVTGLLRVSEPGGGFLRANAPADGRWYSRDVAAILRARGLGAVCSKDRRFREGVTRAAGVSSPGGGGGPPQATSLTEGPLHQLRWSPSPSGGGFACGALLSVFVDADGSSNPGGYPVGGMTIVAFRNAHLAYALTWFGLALLSVVGAVVVLRRGGR